VRVLSLAACFAFSCTRPDPAPPAPADTTPPPAATPSAAPPPPAPSASASVTAEPSAAAPSASASAAPAPDRAGIDEAVNGAIARGEVPGAVVAVTRGGRVVLAKAYGLRTKDPDERPMRVDTVFDLASLTKVLATAPSVMLLVEQGKIKLGDPVAKYLPSFAQNGKDRITVEHLLLHTGGLVADDPLTDYKGGRADAFAHIDALVPQSEPGERFLYSDVGYIVLGELVEKISGQPLDAFARDHFYGPLGMRDTTYNPGPALAARAAPTERRDGVMLQGEVHDPRAHLLGGVAGHAGLFSTAADLATFADMLLHRGRSRGAQILAEPTLLRMTEPHELPGSVRRTLGWDVQSGLVAGYGHTGFTGTALWIDPASDTAVVVLASRLHPDGKGDTARMRREVAAVVMRERPPISAAPPAALHLAPPAGAVLTGLDVLERDGFAVLKGRRVGLVTHAAGADRRGASAVDVLRAAEGVTLVAIFSPEHGLRGGADGAVSDGKDELHGLPVYSLYGERTRPSAAQLGGIDTLVYDLQDAGARFYTYETTLGYLLETAAEHHLKLVVLDRPDPVGGAVVEGPVLSPFRTSFTGYHPLPVRHGMSVGELARLFNAERALGADLEVVKMEGWVRDQTFDRTGLPWVNPSPNLRSVDEALLYPGVGLLEATNVSVGRGTDRPFELVGAPYVDGARLAAVLGALALPGVRVTPTTFVPASSTFAGERCGGVSLHVEDRARLSPVRLGLGLALALARLYPGDWQAKNLLLMVGHEPTVAAVERGDALESIVAGWQPGLAAFLEVRKKYLLY
jgi:uncharacterized protein YbbC (DUF1343 family)/CubicO group peptidase (beta-lactamase class C family)